VSPAAGTEDMDTSHSRLLTASMPGQVPSGYDPGAQDLAAAQSTGSRPAGQPAAACALGAGLASVGISRNFTRMTLRRWGLAGLCDQAELVVSELVTNAIRHGLVSARRIIEEYPVGLRLLAQDPFVTCMVTDPGRKVPIRNPADPVAESGRGLQVVESCSLRWGWQSLDGGGKVVWALLKQELSSRATWLASPAGSRSRRLWRPG
jgi:anti-sigma regulatory factor (Ser/Thr protein kinase)